MLRKQPTITEALDHLAYVLAYFSELHPDDRSPGFDKALAFYNRARPHAQINADEAWSIRLVHTGPLDLKMVTLGLREPDDDN